MSSDPFVRRVRLRNYKSIGECDVALGRFTLLVGRNGSGKSNFLDALRFVTDGLRQSLDHAIRSRGGVDAVRRRSTGHPHHFAVTLDLNLSRFRTACYHFEVGAKQKGFFVKEEQLRLIAANGQVEATFHVKDGEIKESSVDTPPPALNDRLYLVNAAGIPVFREIYDRLTSMGFYNLNPERMRALQDPEPGELLSRDGGNVASVVGRLSEEDPSLRERVRDYLSQVVDDVTDFERVTLGPKETLRFWQAVSGSEKPWRFYAASMSDGTLRALGILIAAMQFSAGAAPVELVGIEEPETALHPAAAALLMDALREGATHTQIAVTTHSPDLLDNYNCNNETLLVVQSEKGTTRIGLIDEVSKQAIREHLYTAGELLRMDQLQPELKCGHQKNFEFAGDNGQ